jgi:hypothetical protein
MNGKARSAYRRTKRTALAVGAITALTIVATDPGAAAPSAPTAPDAAAFGAGTGTAIAIAYKVNPVFGNLSFGITAGESVAGHQNTAAQGQAKSVNLGVIGVTLAGEGCDGADPTLAEEDQPQPVVVASDDPGAADGKTSDLGGAITMFARATKAPFAEATTTVAPVGDPSGAVITGGRSSATSGVVAPGLREARAVSEIGSVGFLASSLYPKGLIQLGDMRWEAIQRTGAKTENIGSFHLGSLVVAGQAIPLPDDGAQQLAVLKDALTALGLQLEVPDVRVEQGIVFVDPMKIGIIPSDLRDAVTGGILGALQPARESLTDFLADYSCGSEQDIFGNNTKTLVTVLDLALAPISGAGRLSLELGGVQATTADIAGFDGLGVLPDLPDLGGVVPDLGDTSTPDLGGTDLTGGAVDVGDTPDTTTTGDDSSPTPTKPIVELEGDRGGALLGVGAGGLLLLLATAEGDRRKMRRAQREIPLEA